MPEPPDSLDDLLRLHTNPDAPLPAVLRVGLREGVSIASHGARVSFTP